MSYKLISFAGVGLPAYNRESNLDTAPPLDGLVGTVLGGYDSYGSDIAPAATPFSLTVRGIVSLETDADQRAAVDALRATSRRRSSLFRQADDDDSQQWCWARLEQIAHRRITGANGYQVLELAFLAESEWYGESIVEEVSLGSSPYAFAVENAGNRMVNDAILTVTAGDVAMTAVTVTTTNGTHLVWAGTLAAGDDLIINSGSKSITNDGANAYGGLTYGASHTIDDWLRIEGGMNITIAYTGGGAGATVGIAFYEGWK